ncbi:MAG TPA: 2'-5' RNA ligase family protein [Dehalococcoidia bacterium]
MAPLFSSFDEAWQWFASGGELVSVDEQREHLTRGRAQFLLFQAPIIDDAAIDEIVDVQDALADIEGLAPMLPEHLHCSIRGVGFQVIETRHDDEILRQDVGRIAERAARIISATAPVEARIGPVNVFPDALIMEVHDGGRLDELRKQLAEAHSRDAFEIWDRYLPHVTIAWFEHPDAAAALRERLPALRERPPVAASIKRVEMTRWWFTGAESMEIEPDVVRSYVLRGRG